MKILRWFIVMFLVLIGVYVGVVQVVPEQIEKARNKTMTHPPYEFTPRALERYESLDFIADLHSDALLWNRDLTKKSDVGHVDFPRMQEANMVLQAFTIVTKSPAGQNFSRNSGDTMDNITWLSIVQGRPAATWFSLLERAVYQCRKLHELASAYDGQFIVVKSTSDLELLLQLRQNDKRVIGGFLGIEGAHCLEGDIHNLDRLYEEGVRMIGLTHFFDNELGGSAHGESGEGLTDFGRQVVKRMNQMGIIIDVAHASPEMVDDILDISISPVLTSHTGVKGTMDNSRNLSDNHIIRIAEGGGLIGVAYFKGAVSAPLIPGIVDAMKHIKSVAGIECIALGSDYDGNINAPFDITGLPLLVEEMMNQGFSATEIEAIMGENFKRFMLRNLR
jgi:microsomal dipeptidase-like Zn-dependent dipeptidase